MLPTDARRLYDFLLVGLMWLREDNPEEPMRHASSIYAAWRSARVLTEKDRVGAKNNVRLITHITSQAQILYGRARRPREELKKAAGTSSQHLLALIPGREGTLAHVQLVSPRGYFIVITDAGMDYASSVLGSYALLDQTAFLAGWRSFATQMRGMNAKREEQG